MIIGFSIIFFYYSSQFYQTYPISDIFNRLNSIQKNVTGFNLKKIDEYFIVTIKGIQTKIIGNKLPNIELKINQKNLLVLEKQRLIRQGELKSFDNSDLKIMVKAKIGLKEQDDFKIRLRVKGKRKLHHYDKDYQSYKVDIRGENRFLGYEELNLQKPITRNYTSEYLYHKLQKEIGNIALDYSFVNLSTNGTSNGVYAIEESVAKELIERHNKRFGPIINTEDSTGEIFPEHTFEARDFKYWTKNNPELLKNVFSILNNFREEKNNYENSFNWKKWANFFAVNDLLGSYHGALSSSVNYYYNPTNGKIEPIGRDAHVGAGNFDNFIILDFVTAEKVNCSWVCPNKEWFIRFFYKKDKSFREEFLLEYLKTLKYLTEKKFIDKFFENHADEIDLINDAIYAEFSKVDKISWKGLAPYVFSKENIYNRSKMIKDKISLYDNFSNNEVEQFVPKISLSKNYLYYDATSKKFPIKIKIQCDENKNIYTLYAIGKFKKKFENCKNLNSAIILSDLEGNSINIDTKNNFETLYFNKIFDYTKLPNILDLFKFEKINDNYRLIQSEITIDENIYIPANTNIIIDKGTKVMIINNSTLFSEGNLILNGSPQKKIMMYGDIKKGGAFVQINGSFKANNFEIKDLSQPANKNFLLYGGLNFVNSEVRIENTNITNSKGEDGINLVNSKSILLNIKVNQIKSDGIDVDGGNFNFTNVNCFQILNDCIDISGAKFNGQKVKADDIGDKVISVGENSKGKLQKLIVKNSNIGVAVKDSSYLELISMDSKKTNLDAVVFTKKEEFGPASLTIKKYEGGDYDPKKFLIGKKNTLIIENNVINGEIKNKKIKKNLYLN